MLQVTTNINILDNDYIFLSEDLKEKAIELLKENDLSFNEQDFEIFYSLSYCQGDGVCFDNLKINLWDSIWTLYIKQSWHYYHSNSMNFDFNYEEDKNLLEEEENKIIFSIKNLCKDLEKYWYNLIESEDEYNSKKETLQQFLNINNIEDEYFIDNNVNNIVLNKTNLDKDLIPINNNNQSTMYINKNIFKDLKEHTREIKTFEDWKEVSTQKYIFYKF